MAHKVCDRFTKSLSLNDLLAPTFVLVATLYAMLGSKVNFPDCCSIEFTIFFIKILSNKLTEIFILYELRTFIFLIGQSMSNSQFKRILQC